MVYWNTWSTVQACSCRVFLPVALAVERCRCRVYFGPIRDHINGPWIKKTHICTQSDFPSLSGKEATKVENSTGAKGGRWTTEQGWRGRVDAKEDEVEGEAEWPIAMMVLLWCHMLGVGRGALGRPKKQSVIARGHLGATPRHEYVDRAYRRGSG
jgi:hypothetical protein